MTQPSDTNGDVPDVHDYVHAARCIDGLTHDVNNRLGAIMAYAELIGLEEGISSETKRMLSAMLVCVQRSAVLLDTISDAVSGPPARPVDVDLCELTRRIADLHSYEIGKAHIALEVKCEGDCSPIRGIKGRLSRAIMIILRNAIERVRPARLKSILIHVQGDEDSMSIIVRDSADVPATLDGEAQGGGPHEAAAPMSLSAAREHARFHSGDLTFDADRGLLLRLPRANDLDK